MALKQNRRSAIKNILAGTAAVTATGVLSSFAGSGKSMSQLAPLKGNINHSVSPWCYHELSLDQLCDVSKQIGITGIDLCGPKDWPTLQKHGMHSPMCNGAEINLTDAHAKLVNIENYIRTATAKHNVFLKELGLSPLPLVESDSEKS